MELKKHLKTVMSRTAGFMTDKKTRMLVKVVVTAQSREF